MPMLAFRTALAMMAASVLFSCAGEKLDLAVKVRMDGRTVAQAGVWVDNEEQGQTNADGVFSKTLRRKPGAEVELVVAKELPGYRIKPWKTTFVVKPFGPVGVYAFDAELQAKPYLTISVVDKSGPIKKASVKADGKDAGETDERGLFVLEYETPPKTGLGLAVTRPGYAAWRKKILVEPGLRIDVALAKQATLSVSALTEEYGQSYGIPGVGVSLGDKELGKTDAQGVFLHAYDGEPDKKALLVLSAPGYIPETWSASIVLEGNVPVRRYFHSTTPRPLRTGIFRFAGNAPNADLGGIVNQTETVLAAQLFKTDCFREVPSRTLHSEMKFAKASIDKVLETGWLGTPLKKVVDLLILGSVARDGNGFLIETKFIAANGKLILSRITRARDSDDINGAAKDIANAALERFPFEGRVVAIDNDRYRINLGRKNYHIRKGSDFILMSPLPDESGKTSGYRETGRLRVKKVDDTGSWAELQDLNKDGKISLGDRVVRRTDGEDEEKDARNYFILSAKGGPPPALAPLPAVNIYVNDEWRASTGPDGKAEVPAPVNEQFTLLLYRHGYRQVTEKITLEQDRDAREFTLAVNNAIFRIDSQPQSADVFVDNEKIGRTPLFEGKPVPLGFHTVRVEFGGEYREWEEVVEFSKKEENRTGPAKIILHKDFIRIGERAEQKGDIAAAIQAYTSAEHGHPDYAEAHHRLARIYLDEKNDFDASIREFENVLSLPENQHLVLKRFSVAFLNLGHAYYEKGNALVRTDQEKAAQNFIRAVQNLEKAKQNARFFPNDRYDEAVHDSYYYTALSYHKLYQITGKSGFLRNADLAWREYFDFFPVKLEGNVDFERIRESARAQWDQLKDR